MKLLVTNMPTDVSDCPFATYDREDNLYTCHLSPEYRACDLRNDDFKLANLVFSGRVCSMLEIGRVI